MIGVTYGMPCFNLLCQFNIGSVCKSYYCTVTGGPSLINTTIPYEPSPETNEENDNPEYIICPHCGEKIYKKL